MIGGVDIMMSLHSMRPKGRLPLWARSPRAHERGERRAPSLGSHWAERLLGVLDRTPGAVALAALAALLVVATLYLMALRGPGAVVPIWEARPLPREWRWERGVEYEHMYRKTKSAADEIASTRAPS